MKKQIVNLIIIFVGGFLVGLLVGFLLPHTDKISNQFKTEQAVNSLNQNAPVAVNDLSGQVNSVAGNKIEFTVRQIDTGKIKSAVKTAQIDANTVIYLLTPKTTTAIDGDYAKESAKIKEQLKQASQDKDSSKIGALKAELENLSQTAGDDRDRQAEELNNKINSLPVASVERLEAERAYLELTSAFKYSKITVADIKSGDAIQVWSQDDLSKNSFTATKIEIQR